MLLRQGIMHGFGLRRYGHHLPLLGCSDNGRFGWFQNFQYKPLVFPVNKQVATHRSKVSFDFEVQQLTALTAVPAKRWRDRNTVKCVYKQKSEQIHDSDRTAKINRSGASILLRQSQF